MAHIRNSIKAVIIENGRILLVKCDRDQNNLPYYILPGGGQEFGECFKNALRRECREELGAEVDPGELVLVREFICANHPKWGECHQVEFMFRCKLLSEINPARATEPDKEQTGTEWVPIPELKKINLYPHTLANCFDAAGNLTVPVYLGAVD